MLTDKELVAKVAKWIKPNVVGCYAKLHGWRMEKNHGLLLIYQHEKAGRRELHVPMIRDDDWPEALFEIVIRLAKQSKISVEETLHGLLKEQINDPWPVSLEWSANVKRNLATVQKLVAAEKELG